MSGPLIPHQFWIPSSHHAFLHCLCNECWTDWAGPITPYSPQRWDHFTALTRDKVFGLFVGGIKNRNRHRPGRMAQHLSPSGELKSWREYHCPILLISMGETVFVLLNSCYKHLFIALRRRGNKNSIQLCTFDNIVLWENYWPGNIFRTRGIASFFRPALKTSCLVNFNYAKHPEWVCEMICLRFSDPVSMYSSLF